MEKRKYLNLRKTNIQTKFQGHSVPNYISYKELAQVINTIDIGTVKNLSDLFSDYKNTHFVYREPVEFILGLAEFYLFVNEERLDKLKWFEHFPCKEASSFLFAIAVGDDSVPGIDMPVLISFINVRERIANSAEQFLLFGADVDKNSGIVTIFFWEISLWSWPCDHVRNSFEKKMFWLSNRYKKLTLVLLSYPVPCHGLWFGEKNK